MRNIFLFLSFFLSLMFISCQDEIRIEKIDIDKDDIIPANSTTAILIEQLTSKDGSFDNIIDGASCISVSLPVTVNANGLEVIVDSEEGFDVIEAIFDEFNDDEDNLDITFPITIILTDYSEVVIETQSQLDTFVDQCIEGGDDDDIECADFIYPITIFTFDTNSQNTGTIVLENDKQLHIFIRNLEENEIISLQFPVTIKFFDESEAIVNNNDELKNALESAKNTCDEDDDNNFNDDDFTKDAIDALLIECAWDLKDIKRNGINLDNQYEEFLLTFSDGGTVTAKNLVGDTFNGTWETSITNDGVLLNLIFNTLDDLTLEWLVNSPSADKIELFTTQGGDEIILRQNCDILADSYTRDDLLAVLTTECFWVISKALIGGINYEDKYIGVPLSFENGGSAKLREKGELINGTWSVSEGAAPDQLFIFFITASPPEFNGGGWLPTRVENDKIILTKFGDELILKRFCENDPDADLIDIRTNMGNGVWELTQYIDKGVDETNMFSGLQFDFDYFGKTGGFAAAIGQGLSFGSWLTLRDDDNQLKFYLNSELGAPYNELNKRWDIIETDANRIELRDFADDGSVEAILVLEKI
ncbi:hypothetical protein [Leptobacterium sp. I13]|uniref:hypothetical protein n=1 Tax=Leptobacterium meishanense TaxID=3128904 RepID=UPI0030EDB4C8